MEALRRVAALGLPTISLHPPGPDSEAYYQVSLSREETGAVIVPDLPLRLHPALSRIKDVLNQGTLGGLLSLRLEVPIDPAFDQDLAREVFPTVVDAVRAIAGDVEAVWAIGQPQGLEPRTALTVYLDMPGGVRAEIGIHGPGPGVRTFTAQCEQGALEFQDDPDPRRTGRLRMSTTAAEERIFELPDWDPHAAILDVLLRSIEGHGAPSRTLPSPNLDDGIRAMEVTEGVVRSLRRERKIDLHYQSIAEDANFKSVMTSTGCLVLLGVLVLLPLALAGRSLGMPWLIHVSYLIPVMLGGFILLQVLRFAIRQPAAGEARRPLSSTGPAERTGDEAE
jgi:myo-inositol 2-dehydrogenase/D-chiro-inositol 1-dehydrogenase